MLNLALDFGNTSIKAGSFVGKELQDVRVFSDIDLLLAASDLISKHSHCIIGSVTDDHQKFIEQYKNSLSIILFTSNTKTPLINLYKTSATLGSDRLAASIGAHSFYPNSDVLCIDCGTCIKYNFVNAHNEYLGGGISPGLQMRFKALEHFTNKLPLVENTGNKVELIGKDTKGSILSGVVNGSIKEVEGIIEEYQNIYPNLKIVITGGDGNFFAQNIKKNGIFTHQNLVLIGLNEILNFELKSK